MAKVLLISCNLTREPYPVYPLGMTLVAQAARGRGHEVVELDLLAAGSTPEEMASRIKTFGPDVIGLSLRNIDNCDSCATDSYTAPYAQFVKTLRCYTSCPIVLGGAGYSLFPEVLLDRIGADYGITGEGEAAFCDLLDRLSSTTPPPRGVIPIARALSGDDFGGTGRDTELAEFYLKKGGMLNVQARRGCPYRCAYCTYPVLEGKSYRFRSPVAVVDEIEMLIENYSADYYAFADSVFNDSQDNYLGIAEELVRRGIDTPWMAFFRPREFEPDQVELLTRAGLHAVEWGTDCASDTTLEAMGKEFTFDQVLSSHRVFVEAGVRCAHFVMFGGPGETEETVAEGLSNLDRLEHSVVFAFCGVRILPGTEVYRRAIDEGLITAEQDLLHPEFYFSPTVAREAVHAALCSSFDSRQDRVYPPSGDEDVVHSLHEMGRRGPLWDLLLPVRRRRRRA